MLFVAAAMDRPVSSVQNESLSQGDSIRRAHGSWDVTPSFSESPVALPVMQAERGN